MLQDLQPQIGNKICPQIENYHVLSLVTGVLVVSLKGVQTKHIYRASEYVTVFSHHWAIAWGGSETSHDEYRTGKGIGRYVKETEENVRFWRSRICTARLSDVS